MSTWSEMLSHVRGELEETSASIWSDSSLLRFLNDGAQDFARKTLSLEDEQYTDWVAGNDSMELPDYTIDVSSVFYHDHDESLQRVTMKDYTRGEQTDTTGDPIAYAVYGGAVWLYPQPTDASQIRFFRYYYPTPITSETDTVPYSGDHEYAMRNYIKARAYEQIGDFIASDRFQMLYDREAEETGWESMRSRSADEPMQPSVGW